MANDGENDIGARNEALRAAWPTHPERAAFEAKLEREHFIPSGTQTDSSSTPAAPDKHDLRNAEIKARHESGQPEDAPPMGPSVAETQVIEKFQAEMGTAGYVEFYKDAQAGLAQYKTWENAEAAMLGAGIDPNDAEDVEEAYRFMAKRGAKLRRSRR